MAVEGKALGLPRGGIGEPVPSESPSTAEPGALYPPSLLYTAALFRMPSPKP